MVGARCALVVDDSRAARHRIATILTLGGWQVHEAAGISEALRKAAHVRPGLVVAEASLRGGSGIGLVHMMRRSGSRARFLVVANRQTETVRALAAAAGAEACLAKPVDPAEVVDFLRGTAAERRPNRTVFRQSVLQVRSARADQDAEDDGPSWAERQRRA